MIQREVTLPPYDLIDLVLKHRGVVSQAQLLQRYSNAMIKRWLREQVLAQQGDDYTLDQMSAYVDGPVLAQWAVPGGIIGARSALVFYGLTVALPKQIDVCLPPNWSGTLPLELGIRPLLVPASLRDYGVITVYPSPPETVPVQMYSPEVALAQTWADPTVPEEDKLDALVMYRTDPAYNERLLQEASERYGVTLPSIVKLP
jgi:hypothetical protein